MHRGVKIVKVWMVFGASNAILSDQCVGESFGALTMGLVTACLRYVSKAILEGAFRRGQAVFRAKELGY